MKIRKRLVAVLAGALFLPGCYDFDFPLDQKPVVPVDTRLLGGWRCLGTQADADDAPGTLRIVRRSDTVSRWSFESLSADGSKEQSDYDVHGSTVKGGALLNALEQGEKANRKWNLVRYSFLLPDVLRLQIVDEKPFEKATTAEALRLLVEKRVNDLAIYADLLVCVRLKSSSAPSPSPTPAR
jgi:hypothetical protein